MSDAARYSVSIPNDEYWRGQIRCQTACPVHTDARGYVRAIARGDIEQAYLIARGPNPLASICGSICGAPCEFACRRGMIDEPVTIRALKRYASEEGGPDLLAKELDLIETLRVGFSKRESVGEEEAGNLIGAFGRVSGTNSVAIVGSGPAGLAAAHDLALMGLRPTIYEMEPVAAGMLYLGVPEYRLPRRLIDAEVGFIRDLGVEIRTGVDVGKDISIGELLEGHAAVIIAIGAKRSKRLLMEGVDGPGVFGGVEFLRDVALGKRSDIGEKVVVIGGGNVAYDVSRTVLREGDTDDFQNRRLNVDVQQDVSRAALRQAGVKIVHLCCLESRKEMLADEREVLEGSEEGVQLYNSLGPDRILRDEAGRVRGVRFKKVLSIFDERGRFAPQYDEDTITEIEANTVLFAVGQQSDFGLLDPDRDGVAFSERGTPEVDDSLSTTRQGLFVAGDAAHGPKLMIDAIASGKRVARSVYEHVTGQRIAFQQESTHSLIPGYKREPGYECLPRREPLAFSPDERLSDPGKQVEKPFTAPAAVEQASRCLDCGVNTIFDGGKCVLCGGCVEICPESCLKIVSLDRLDFAASVDSGHKNSEENPGYSAIIKNDERCTRCGLCAIRCPVGAITMERYQFQCSLHRSGAN